MAGLVLSSSAGCGGIKINIRQPLLLLQSSTRRFINNNNNNNNNNNIIPLLCSKVPIFSSPKNLDRVVAKVSAPLRIQLIEEEQEDNDDIQTQTIIINGLQEEEEEELLLFDDAGAPPPFKLSDIRAAIPKHCWVKDPWRSMSYVARDVAIVLGLAAAAAHLNTWLIWPLYWAAQGTMFWALFVLGHDCGHGSFSNNPKLNSVVGHLLHSSILVPYHGWRISHRTHHQNHGHVENDESWHPLTEKTFKSLDWMTRTLRFSLPFPMLAYPFYLWNRSPGKSGSHFDPNSDLFVPVEKKDVITSTICWTTMLALLLGLNFVVGPMQMLKLYGIPY